MKLEQKIIDAAREFGHMGERMGLGPDELISALHMAISGCILAKYQMETFQKIQLL